MTLKWRQAWFRHWVTQKLLIAKANGGDLAPRPPSELYGGKARPRVPFFKNSDDHHTEWNKSDRERQISYAIIWLGGFPGGCRSKEPTCQCRRHTRCGFDPCVRKIPRRRAWQSTPVSYCLYAKSEGKKKDTNEFFLQNRKKQTQRLKE